ncbi:MAG TPA: PIF1 family DEAD/DEAH box helicase [Candidatus Saccharimonadales bacterium]|nr:PIF1 family DEAD/DEAH box helicase [Candidatus Saccharimonadales bacterium]
MDQTLALEILIDGHNTLLTGPAGSGKTYVLNQFIRHAKSVGKHVSVTATTGLAATHLGGNTIHSWSGIGIHDVLPRYFYEDMKKGRRETIERTDILIIDEISMLHDYRLDMIDEILRRTRRDDTPFGGIQVIFCGDFFQLPPVERGNEQANFVIEAEVWRQLDPVICYLNEQHRQHDADFLGVLEALRAGDIRRRHVEALLGRQDHDIGQVTELHTTNADVDAINLRQLADLPGGEHRYQMQTTGSSNYVETLKKSCLAREELVLKKGAFVMCLKNSLDKKYSNGSLGEVVGFDKDTDYPIVELKNGRRLTIAPDSWELRDGDKKRASLSQIPLRLAWAITVHKSQGMTLDAARIDLRRAFVEGMGYVALSRVRSLDTLSLVGLNRMALKVSPVALEIDASLRTKSVDDAKRLNHLRERAKRRQINPIKPKTNSWNDKLVKMREKHPNAYRPWSEADDAKLVKLFSTGKAVSLDKLTEEFGRHPGSIKARLAKHFGEDAVSFKA